MDFPVPDSPVIAQKLSLKSTLALLKRPKFFIDKESSIHHTNLKIGTFFFYHRNYTIILNLFIF